MKNILPVQYGKRINSKIKSNPGKIIFIKQSVNNKKFKLKL